jgi:hypothetical protein
MKLSAYAVFLHDSRLRLLNKQSSKLKASSSRKLAIAISIASSSGHSSSSTFANCDMISESLLRSQSKPIDVENHRQYLDRL